MSGRLHPSALDCHRAREGSLNPRDSRLVALSMLPNDQHKNESNHRCRDCKLSNKRTESKQSTVPPSHNGFPIRIDKPSIDGVRPKDRSNSRTNSQNNQQSQKTTTTKSNNGLHTYPFLRIVLILQNPRSQVLGDINPLIGTKPIDTLINNNQPLTFLVRSVIHKH